MRPLTRLLLAAGLATALACGIKASPRPPRPPPPPTPETQAPEEAPRRGPFGPSAPDIATSGGAGRDAGT